MAALKLDMQIPIGITSHIHLHIDITDLGELTLEQRQVLADTGREFCEFAARTLAPEQAAASAMIDPPQAEIHDPNGRVLAGVTGSRRNSS